MELVIIIRCFIMHPLSTVGGKGIILSGRPSVYPCVVEADLFKLELIYSNVNVLLS